MKHHHDWELESAPKCPHNRAVPAGKIERRSAKPRAATSLMRRPGRGSRRAG